MNVARRVVQLQAPSPVAAVIEVVVLERRPGKLRAWVARLLLRLAGRVAGLRVRIVPGD